MERLFVTTQENVTSAMICSLSVNQAKIFRNHSLLDTQQTCTCPYSTIRILQKGVKYV